MKVGIFLPDPSRLIASDCSCALSIFLFWMSYESLLHSLPLRVVIDFFLGPPTLQCLLWINNKKKLIIIRVAILDDLVFHLVEITTVFHSFSCFVSLQLLQTFQFLFALSVCVHCWTV